MSVTAKSVSALDNIVVKSPNDRRLYRVIELENGLCAILIHDPDIYPEGSVPDQIDKDNEVGEEEEENSDGSDEDDDEEGEGDEEDDDEDADDVKGKGGHQTKKAAAAMCVAMGSFLDPPEAQGLAHLLEHMLSMGSTEFPDENEYDSYLSKHGGSSNAYTEMEHTCYHFEVKREFLRGALKRFSQFFVAPLMKTEAMEREVLAVDSEFNQALQNDACRLQQLQCCTSAKGHPFNRFAWGNKKSLSGAMENGVDLRECIVKLYKQYYHGGLMKLVVIGGESLDMLESWVVELFNDVKNGSQIRPTLEAEVPIWKGGKSYRLEAVKDVHILDLTWTLPPLRHAYVKKPEDYLAHLLGHEGGGSLHSFLKSKGWATSLSAGVGDDGINRSSLAYVFGMSIHLTDSGLEKIYDIIGYIYQYLKLLRDVSPQEWIFKELQDIGNMDFRFPKEQPADDYAAELSENMLAYPVEHVIYGDYVYQTWDPKLIEDLMGFFTPKNMRIDVVSKSTKSEEFQHEPWFGSRYIEENVPLSLMETWSNPSEVDKSLHLPSKNQFIPCDFSIRAINSDGDPKSQSPPKCVIDDSDEKLSVLNDLSLNDLNSFIPELRSQALCHGNLSEDEAVNISNIYKNSLIVEPLPSKCRHGEQITCFPLSAKLVRDANVKNKKETNSVVEHYYQIQPEEAESTRIKAVLDLFHEIIEEPLFNQLRTKEQLGCVQSSEYGPVHLLERVDDFIKDIEGPVIQPLLHASDLSYSLEDCLKFLLEASRTDSGRSDLASRSILLCILRLLQLLPYPSSRHYLNLSLKVLRNLCAGDVSNQNSFVDHDGSVLISDLLDSAIAEKITDFETVRFGLQVLANVVLFGEKRQRDVWLRFFPERFLSIAKIRRQETCDPLCMILYTCFDGSSELASQLCSNEGLTIIVETLRTSSSVGSVEDYWLKLLVSRICVEDDFFPQLVSKLAPRDGESETFTSEQAFLLRMLSDIANERIGQVSIPKVATQSVLNLFRQSVGVFDFVSGERSELPTGSTIIDVMGYSLVIIRDACAGGSLEELKKDNKDSGDTVELLLYSGIIELLLDLLHKLEPPTTIKKAQNQNPTSSSSSLKPCPYRGFRRDIVSVIGNCVYRRKEVQDEIRERDGLFLMLQQCVTDDENPFLREWGLFCVRNLLEGNPENQKAVAELEVQGSVDVPQLREIGLRVEIDPKTARPKLVNDT